MARIARMNTQKWDALGQRRQYQLLMSYYFVDPEQHAALMFQPLLGKLCIEVIFAQQGSLTARFQLYLFRTYRVLAQAAVQTGVAARGGGISQQIIKGWLSTCNIAEQLELTVEDVPTYTRIGAGCKGIRKGLPSAIPSDVFAIQCMPAHLSSSMHVLVKARQTVERETRCDGGHGTTK